MQPQASSRETCETASSSPTSPSSSSVTGTSDNPSSSSIRTSSALRMWPFARSFFPPERKRLVHRTRPADCLMSIVRSFMAASSAARDPPGVRLSMMLVERCRDYSQRICCGSCRLSSENRKLRHFRDLHKGSGGNRSWFEPFQHRDFIAGLKLRAAQAILPCLQRQLAAVDLFVAELFEE